MLLYCNHQSLPPCWHCNALKYCPPFPSCTRHPVPGRQSDTHAAPLVALALVLFLGASCSTLANGLPSRILGHGKVNLAECYNHGLQSVRIPDCLTSHCNWCFNYEYVGKLWSPLGDCQGFSLCCSDRSQVGHLNIILNHRQSRLTAKQNYKLTWIRLYTTWTG